MYQYHVIDPTYFYDAIAQFAFNYNWYPLSGCTIDDLGMQHYVYEQKVINGSLQSQGTTIQQTADGNREDMQYRFFCKSLYRISVGDFIKYKDRYLRVTSVRDYDEWGVRSCVLQMVNLSNYKDFEEFIKYLEGERIV